MSSTTFFVVGVIVLLCILVGYAQHCDEKEFHKHFPNIPYSLKENVIIIDRDLERF